MSEYSQKKSIDAINLIKIYADDDLCHAFETYLLELKQKILPIIASWRIRVICCNFLNF